jgi:hypothetical protein
MIASLEWSSIPEDDNDQERGGRRSSSPNKNQRHSTSYSPAKEQQHSASYSHSHSPNKTQHSLPPRGTVHDFFSCSAPTPGVGHGPSANTREEAGRKRNDQITPPCSSLALPAPAYARSYWPWLALFIDTTCGVSVRFYCVTIPINRHWFAIRFYAF